MLMHKVPYDTLIHWIPPNEYHWIFGLDISGGDGRASLYGIKLWRM